MNNESVRESGKGQAEMWATSSQKGPNRSGPCLRSSTQSADIVLNVRLGEVHAGV